VNQNNGSRRRTKFSSALKDGLMAVRIVGVKSHQALASFAGLCN
jgi:hypothetical protein